MKKAGFLVSACLTAMPAATDTNNDDWRETCAEISKLAEAVMTKRQAGAAMAELIAVAEETTVENIIIDAYEFPRYSTERNKKETIEDFRDTWYLNCVKSSR